MKFDFNKVLILFLLISTIGFGLTWYFGGFDASKERVKQLESDYKKLESEKKIAEEKILAWQEVYRLKDIEDKKLIIEVTNAKKELMIARAMAAKFELELSNIKGDMQETRREIEELKNNPKVLTDEELLKDLIKNTTTKEIQKVDSKTIKIKHKVLKKETLYSLSKLYNVSITEIIEQNKFLNNGLQTGQTLIITK